ncbi:transporter substrate-binding domain-containing protein [Kitasatospora sp. NPDC094019]|uniref:transporter substrate-binding domain-containing protein n=1 Tax=Kitasatospora sp. NPDC094019 TaxID=3364091 RepID=UPI00381B185C
MRGNGGLLLAGVLVGLLSLSGCSDQQKSMFDQEIIHVGIKNNQPGTSMLNSNHNWEGFDVQIANQITKALGSTPFFNDVASAQREAVLISHADDLVIATYSITPARMDLVHFIGPYAVTQQGFMVRAENAQIDSLEGFREKTVCSWTGTTSLEELRILAKSGFLRVIEKSDVEQCREELMADRAFAVSTDQLLLYGIAESDPRLKVVPKVTVGTKNYYGVGIRKNRQEDCRRIRDFLRQYVVGSDWVRDLRTAIPGIDNPEDFRPNPLDTARFSCVDKVD